MKKDEDIKLGSKIKEIRMGNNIHKKAYNQKDFSKMINATVQALSNWENGRNQPNTARLQAIADIGGVTVNELLNYDLTREDIENHYLIECAKHLNKEQQQYILDNKVALSQVLRDLIYDYGINNSGFLVTFIDDRMENWVNYVLYKNIPSNIMDKSFKHYRFDIDKDMEKFSDELKMPYKRSKESLFKDFDDFYSALSRKYRDGYVKMSDHVFLESIMLKAKDLLDKIDI